MAAAPTPSSLPGDLAVTGTGISRTPEYIGFRSSVQRKVITVQGKPWRFFDIGPRNVAPLVMIPGLVSTADSLFYPLLTLGNKGYRVVALQPPPHFTHQLWCEGLAAFLRTLFRQDRLHAAKGQDESESKGDNRSSSSSPLELKVHLFGADLGGFLCLHFAHRYPAMVASLVLSGSYCDNTAFKLGSAWLSMYRGKWLPEFYLKRVLLDQLPRATFHPAAVDFIVEQVESITKEDASARLTLRGLPAEVGRIQLPMEKISFLDCLDESNLPEELRTLLQERFPGACEMMMKEGGDFPYLSNPQEFCMLLQVHLRRNGLFPRLQLSPEELHKEQELMRQAFVGSDGFDLPASGSGNGSVNGGGGGGNYGDEVKGQDGTHFFQLSSGPDSASKRHSQMAAGVSIAVDGDTLVIGGGNDSDEDGQHSGGDSLDWM